MPTCPTCRTQYPANVARCANDGDALLDDAAFASADRPLQAGEMVGEYKVEAQIGAGGFGSVFRAVHPLIGKVAAIKVLSRQFSSNPQMVSRFVDEARAVNQIRHRNIIDIFSFGALPDGRQYYVMELLDGMTLDKHIAAKGRLGPGEAVPILRGIARALDAAHAKGIAHRDLKPENVFLVFDEDGTASPKLLDFGIAKLLSDPSKGHKTETGTPMGTPYYMSPEQCRGLHVDHRTDIYSFGVLAYEALTGSVPFSGESTMDVLLKHLSAPAPNVSATVPELAPLDAPIARMMAKEPEQRPESVGLAVDALAAAAVGMGALAASHPAATGSSRKLVAESARSHGASTVAQDGAHAASLAITPPVVSAKDLDVQTLLPSADDVRPSGQKKTLLVAAAALVIVATSVAAAVIFLRVRAPAPPALATRESPSSAPRTTAGAAASVSVAAPPEVSRVFVHVDGAPAGAPVFLGADKIGEAPGPIELHAGASAVKLTIKAKGYLPADVSVVPSSDQQLTVTLKRPAAQGGTTLSKDLEPF